MLISTLNCEMWPNFSYHGVRSVQPLLLLSLLMVFSSENFGFSPPYAGIAGIGPAMIISLISCSNSDIRFVPTSQKCKCSHKSLYQNLQTEVIGGGTAKRFSD